MRPSKNLGSNRSLVVGGSLGHSGQPSIDRKKPKSHYLST